MKPLDQIRHQSTGPVGRSCDADHIVSGSGLFCDLLQHLFLSTDRLFRPLHIYPSGRGEGDRVGASVKDRNAQLSFEVDDI